MKRLVIVAIIIMSCCSLGWSQDTSSATLASLQKQIADQAQRLQRLEREQNMPAEITRDLGSGLALIVGEYVWTDATGQRLLRYQGLTESGEYLRGQDGNELVT